MIFIIGGYAQGKRALAIKQYAIEEAQLISGEHAREQELLDAEYIYDFHLLVKRWTADKKDYRAELTKLLEQGCCKVLISDEVGYGIVPVDAFEREYRENVGRASCIVAKQAEKVIRVTCGIGQRIK